MRDLPCLPRFKFTKLPIESGVLPRVDTAPPWHVVAKELVEFLIGEPLRGGGGFRHVLRGHLAGAGVTCTVAGAELLE